MDQLWFWFSRGIAEFAFFIVLLALVAAVTGVMQIVEALRRKK